MEYAATFFDTFFFNPPLSILPHDNIPFINCVLIKNTPFKHRVKSLGHHQVNEVCLFNVFP